MEITKLKLLPEYKSALRLRPNDATLQYYLGSSEYLAGQVDDAIKSNNSALENGCTRTYLRINLGLCYATLNDWPRAKQEYDRALKVAEKFEIKWGTSNVQDAIKKRDNPALEKALVYLQKAGGK